MNAVAIEKPRYRVRTDGVAYPAPTAGAPAPRSPSAAYMRNEQLPVFFRWNPALRDASDDVKVAWRQATARTIDAIHNSGWLAGCAEQSTASVVGTGLKLNAKPNADALGWTQGEANEWARRVETRFSMWADNAQACDAGARFKFGQMLAQAYRHWMATGEILATLPWIPREGTQFGTKLRLLPAWRMSSRSEPPTLCNGVRIDRFSAPIGYIIKVKTGYGAEMEIEYPATDGFGRPRIVHIFDGEPEQYRGISPFTPVLKVTRQFDQLADATLTAAIIQAVFAAMFKSPAPGEDALSAMQSGTEQETGLQTLLTEKVDWYNKTDLNLGIHGKILHGFPGDELQFFRSEHPNSTYEAFAKFLLREISRAGAMTYEEFTGDYAGATFSSVKMGTAVVWPRVLYRREHIVAALAQRCYEAWLEEDIEAGRTPFPGGIDGFLQNREAASQAFWRGPTKPQADDLKAAQAAAAWQKVGVPDRVIFDELGGDVDDWYEERQREQARREDLGLKDRGAVVQPGGNRGEDRPEENGDGSDRDREDDPEREQRGEGA